MESVEAQQVHFWTASFTWCISFHTNKQKNSVNSSIWHTEHFSADRNYMTLPIF